MLAVLLIDARAATDDLLELGHGLDALVEHNQLAGLCVNACCQQLGCRGDDGIARLRIDEIVEFCLSLRIIAGDPHDIAVVLRDQIGIRIGERLPHAFGVLGVLAKDDRLVETVRSLQELRNLCRD